MKNKVPFADLVTIKEQVDKLVEQNKFSNDSPNFKALQNVLRLIINEESFRTYFDQLTEVVLSMGRFDFSKRLPINNSGDLFCFISTSLNLLSEELEVLAAPKHYLEETLELLPEAAILTNDKGEIQYLNQRFESLTKFKRHELIGKSLSAFFRAEFVAKCLKEDLDLVINEKTLLFDRYLNYIPAITSIKKMKGANNRANGFIFSIKRLGEKDDFSQPL
jgi:PAS domain S-box-containing protein